MSSQTTAKGKIVREYLEKYHTRLPKLTLAKLIFKDNPLDFKSVDDVRGFIRYYTGQKGKHNRHYLRKDKFVEDNDKTKINFAPYCIPESESADQTPFHLPKAQNKIGVISDLHIPNHRVEPIEIALSYFEEKGANTIIINGDLLDNTPFTHFVHKRPSPSDVTRWFDTAEVFLEGLRERFPDATIYWTAGNHCLDTETEVMTIDGWKKYDEITEGDFFGTYNIEKQQIEYLNADRIIIREHEGEMYRIKNNSIDLLMTDKHRVLYKENRHNSDGGYQLKEIDELVNTRKSRVTFKCSSTENNIDYDGISDDELRLVAFILTDGYIGGSETSPKYVLCQSGEKVKLAHDILNSLGYKYTTLARDRDIKSICGKVLRKRPKTSYELNILAESAKRLREILPTKKYFPKWLDLISDRQFDIFHEVLIYCNGTTHKSGAVCLYGNKKSIEYFQTLYFKHNYRTSIYTYRDTQYRLNIHKSDNICTDSLSEIVSKENYRGKVWCITNSNSTMIVRRNGKISITGNCEWYTKWMWQHAWQLSDDPFYSLQSRLHLDEYKINYIDERRYMMAGKLAVVHGHHLVKGIIAPVNAARGVFLRAKQSVLIGHVHVSSEHTETNLIGDIVTCWSTGCLCSLTPDYQPMGGKANHGFAYITVKDDGSFHVENKRIHKNKLL